MALQSVSSTQNVFAPRAQASAAIPIISALISSQVRLSQQPVQLAETIRAQSSLESVQARLTAQVSDNTGRLAEFQSLQSTFTGVTDLLSSLSTLVADAQTATVGELPTFQAAAQDIITQIRSSLNSFEAKGDFTFNVLRPAGVGPAANSQVVERLSIESVNRSIPTAGIAVTVQAVAGGATANLTGARAQLQPINLTGGVAGQLDNDVDFQITGPIGSATFNLTTGTTTADVIAAINAETSSTGLTAEETAAGSNIIILASEFIGSQYSVTLTELSDPGGELTGGSSTGVDAYLDVTVDGVTQQVAADGRLASFDINGVTGKIKLFDLYNNTFGLNESIGTAAITLTIQGGGLQVDQSTSGSTRVGIPGLRFDTIAQIYGGLDSIDLVNNRTSAQRVVDQAVADVASGQGAADSLVTAFSERITAETNQLASITSQIQTTESVLRTLSLFQSIQAEADFQTASLLFSQTSSLFPISAAKLLG